MAAMIPSTAFLPRTIHLDLSTHSRRAIERQIDTLIALLDQIDGDPDLEQEETDDDPCDYGEPFEYAEMLPLYGIDQSLGPINEAEVHEAHMNAAMAGCA